MHRDSGWRGIWFGAMAMTSYRWLALLERSLADPIVAPRGGSGMTVRILDAADADRYAALRPDTAPRVFADRLDRSEVCVGTFEHERLVAAGWLTLGHGPVPYLGHELALSEGVAWSYDGFTLPALRGRSVGTVRLAALLEAAEERGAQSILAAILPENRSAFGPVARTGWRRVGTLRAVRLPGGSWRMTSSPGLSAAAGLPRDPLAARAPGG